MILDYNNNEFYLMDYNCSERDVLPSKFNKLPLNNDMSHTFDTLAITPETTKDSVGLHFKFKRGEPLELKGSLYSDFLVYDSVLLIAHGKYVSVFDLLRDNDKA